MKTTKKYKRLLLLWVLMVNLLPSIKDGQVTWTTMRVEAQQYIVELPTIPPGTIPPLAVCHILSNNMGLTAVSGYSDKRWCGILVLASLTKYTPEHIAEWYAELMGITVEEISSTNHEESWYPRFGVSIGSMLTTRDKCEINQALYDAGPGTGLFVSNPGHVYVIYEITYDPEIENGTCWKYDTEEGERTSAIIWDDITSITSNMYLISK
jgi:hypothetical protein